MPRSNRPPSYRLHRARNCAVVTIHSQNQYLGPYGSPESHQKYARLIAEWRAGADQSGKLSAGVASEASVSVNELILTFWRFAKTHYLRNGHHRRAVIGQQGPRQTALLDGLGEPMHETIKEHVQHTLHKIGVTNRTQAAVWAVRKGLA